ncbi:MAG: UDP-3-O-(3-hydroxymyristoyl)glucosamine N-acyltransferase, partial [Acidobacteriota bacterium]
MKVRDIAELVGGTFSGDGDLEIISVASLETSSKGDVAFFEGHDLPADISASCLIVAAGCNFEADITLITVDRPKLAFAQTAAALCPPVKPEPDIHPSAAIGKNAVIAEEVFVGAFSSIGEASSVGEATQVHAGARLGDRVTIGKRCVIYPNVVIEDGCTLGDGVILHSGVVIGADGFGYVRDNDGAHVKFPQIGTVVIDNDVEIGANTCVDRGALGETRIGEGTKIDNLVQIGHNVRVGKRCVIAAQTGISGSVTIEDDCVI